MITVTDFGSWNTVNNVNDGDNHNNDKCRESARSWRNVVTTISITTGCGSWNGDKLRLVIQVCGSILHTNHGNLTAVSSRNMVCDCLIKLCPMAIFRRSLCSFINSAEAVGGISKIIWQELLLFFSKGGYRSCWWKMAGVWWSPQSPLFPHWQSSQWDPGAEPLIGFGGILPKSQAILHMQQWILLAICKWTFWICW